MSSQKAKQINGKSLVSQVLSTKEERRKSLCATQHITRQHHKIARADRGRGSEGGKEYSVDLSLQKPAIQQKPALQPNCNIKQEDEGHKMEERPREEEDH